MRVLIVSEDAKERQRAATALAMRSDIEIVEATSAAQCRALHAAAPADVLVIDGDLKPKGGFSMLYELRAAADLHSAPHVPAIVLVERAPDQWLAAWARADGTATKPVDPFALAKQVDRLVGHPAPEAPAGA